MASDNKSLILLMENALITYATFIYIQNTVAVDKAARAAEWAASAAKQATENYKQATDAAEAAEKKANAREAKPEILNGLFKAILELDNTDKCNIVSRYAWYIEILLKYDCANDDASKDFIKDAIDAAATDAANAPAIVDQTTDIQKAISNALKRVESVKSTTLDYYSNPSSAQDEREELINNWRNIKNDFLNLANPEFNKKWIQNYIQDSEIIEPQIQNVTIPIIVGSLVGIGGTLGVLLVRKFIQKKV